MSSPHINQIIACLVETRAVVILVSRYPKDEKTYVVTS